MRKELPLNSIICGDCVKVMKEFPDECVDLVVTSPPYDKLRDYKGYNFYFEEVAKELFRIVKIGGVIVWVVGDQVINGSETGTSFKQALYFKKTGFSLHDTMIYEKTGFAFPEKNRYYQQFEYMFVFSKEKPKTVNLIKDRFNKTAGEKRTSTSSRLKNGEIERHYLINGMRIKRYGVRGNIWKYHSGGIMGFRKLHPAVFPLKLAIDHIISWSNKGDIVLDPMCGSGTVCKAAKLLKRKYVGIDISQDYCKLAAEILK